MTLSVTTNTENTQSDENESPLGKRKTDSTLPSDRNPKRSPLAAVRANAFNNRSSNEGLAKVGPTPSKRGSIGTTATPYSSTKFRGRVVSKDEIQATDEGRASVNKLSEWLANESAKKAKPKTIVPAPTPVRFRMKPKIKKEDVEATDDKRVSVKKLSEWISDDPFEQKKIRHIRSGAKIIAKSRNFEADTKVIATSRQIEIKAGSVNERQEWLTRVFSHDEEDEHKRPPIAKDRATPSRPYQCKTKKEVESPDSCLKSVHDKKEWLTNAFKKGDQTTIRTSKSFDGITTPAISKCASADDADEACILFPNICQQSSYDGIKTPLDDKEPPVRLYKSTKCVEADSPEKSIQSVQARQEWLSKAFKKTDASRSSLNSQKVDKVASKKPNESSSLCPGESKSEGETPDVKHASNAIKKSDTPKLPGTAGEHKSSQNDQKVEKTGDKKSIDGAPQCSGGSKNCGETLEVKVVKEAAVVEHGGEKVSVAERAKWLQGVFKPVRRCN